MRVISCAAMSVPAPTVEQLRSIATSLGFRMSDEDLGCYLELMRDGVAAYSMIDALPDYLPSVRYPRGAGYRPHGDENRYGAWYWKTNIQGASAGKLAGRKIGLKGNICVAGVPTSGGASILEGYVADIDAMI